MKRGKKLMERHSSDKIRDKIISLDLNNPNDAREFIKDAMPKCFDDISKITHFDLEDGTRISTKNLSDSQAVQYAWELLPIYQSRFPALVKTDMEH